MKLLALVEEPDHVCCRYRIRAFERARRVCGLFAQLRGARSGRVLPIDPASSGEID